MLQIFNTLINSYIDNKVGIVENFLSLPLAADLKTQLQSHYSGGLFMPAGTGNNNTVVRNVLVRSDKIYWLDRKHNTTHENNFFSLMDKFVSHLNSSCYTGITGYEFHYALYETGSFYKKHLDQFHNNKSRQYSMIMYLNTDWQETDGGELCIHRADTQQNISPINGKTVFFKSNEIEHEVLVTNKPRLSITGWLKVD